MDHLARFLLAIGWLVGLASSAAAQTEPPPPAAIPLVARAESGAFDPESLRQQLERELAVPVRVEREASGSHLIVEASKSDAIRVAFVREDGGTAERVVDVSSVSAHADETLALVAANLMRDEASVLLAALRAKTAPDQPPPTAAVATPAVAVLAKEAEAPRPMGCDPNGLRRRTIGLDVLPYVGMSSSDRTAVERTISLNLFGGVTGAVRGIEVAGLFNIDGHSVCGLQLSGIANLVDGPVQGVQASLINWAGGGVDGAQFGLVSSAFGSLRGVQYGLLGFATGDIAGAQFGLMNIGAGSLTGAQFGLVNVAARDVNGAQLGLANISGAALTGAQLGFVNVSRGPTQGTQLGLANVNSGALDGFQAGLVNVGGGRVHGGMVGLVNVAEDADVAVGLVNVLWHGRTHLDVWFTDTGLAMVGIEHGSRYVHNITAFGVGSRDGRAWFAPAYGIGVRVFRSDRLFIDVDALAYAVIVHDKAHSQVDCASVNQLRLPVSVRLTPEIALFVAPALNVSVAGASDDLLLDPALYASTRLTKSSATTTVRMWPGFSVGARFF